MKDCPTCQGWQWTRVSPQLPDTYADVEDERRWIGPCPRCSPDLPLSEVAKRARMAGETVGWTIETLVRPDGGVVEVPWPFIPYTAFELAGTGRWADARVAAEFINGAWTEEEPGFELVESVESFLQEVWGEGTPGEDNPGDATEPEGLVAFGQNPNGQLSG